jgi:hypothetical protein
LNMFTVILKNGISDDIHDTVKRPNVPGTYNKKEPFLRLSYKIEGI